MRTITASITKSWVRWHASPQDRPRVLQTSHYLKQASPCQDLVAKWHNGEFDLGAYKDRYREKIKEAIDKKKNGEVIEAPEEEKRPEGINLMDALKQSVKGVGAKKTHATTKRAPAKRKRA